MEARSIANATSCAGLIPFLCCNRSAIDRCVLVAKAAEEDVVGLAAGCNVRLGFADGYFACVVDRDAVDAGAEAREGNAVSFVIVRQAQRIAIAVGEQAPNLFLRML